MHVRVSAQTGVMTETPDSPLLRKPHCQLRSQGQAFHDREEFYIRKRRKSFVIMENTPGSAIGPSSVNRELRRPTGNEDSEDR
jgi:hypothetical protein